MRADSICLIIGIDKYIFAIKNKYLHILEYIMYTCVGRDACNPNFWPLTFYHRLAI